MNDFDTRDFLADCPGVGLGGLEGEEGANVTERSKPRFWKRLDILSSTLRNIAAAAFFLSGAFTNVAPADIRQPPQQEVPQRCNGMQWVDSALR